ncbi:hypothetical protein PISMIDRAFT_122525, partial [Pisolithus microcarpus 441]
IKPESSATTQEIIFLAHQGQSLRGILINFCKNHGIILVTYSKHHWCLQNAIGRHLYAVFPTCAWAVLPLISSGTARNVQEVSLSLMDMKDHPIPSQSMYPNQKEADKKPRRPHFQWRHHMRVD